jgi:ElaA protein
VAEVKISAVPFAALDRLTAYSLWKLRQDVFVVEQVAAYADLDGRDLAPETRHVVLEDEKGAVLGCARVLDAQSPLAGWYATFGFEVCGPEFLEDFIPHLPMVRRAQ